MGTDENIIKKNKQIKRSKNVDSLATRRGGGGIGGGQEEKSHAAMNLR